MVENRIANASTGKLLSGIVSDAEQLVQQQFRLFKEEIKDEIREAKKATLPMVAGAGVLCVSVFLFCFAIVYLLQIATGLPEWVCFAIVAAVLGVSGGVTFAVGMQRMRELTPVAEKSVEELKENVRWLTRPN